jgi:hypothetical protein
MKVEPEFQHLFITTGIPQTVLLRNRVSSKGCVIHRSHKIIKRKNGK